MRGCNNIASCVVLRCISNQETLDDGYYENLHEFAKLQAQDSSFKLLAVKTYHYSL